MMPRRKAQAEENVDSWLMSYADLITLLLCFFIIFVSTSEPKQDKLAAATRGLQGKFGSMELESAFDGMYREIQGTIAVEKADRVMSVEKTPRGLVIELSTLRFYNPGTADMMSDQQEVLNEIMQHLTKGKLQGYGVEIEGHTDSMQPANSAVSNWDLSAARAARIADMMMAAGLTPERMHVSGYAGTKPAVPNVDANGNPIPENREKNQRVVIRLEKRN